MFDGNVLWDMVVHTNHVSTIYHQACPYCSNGPSKTFHLDSPCPHVRSIDYYPAGGVKRVEFWPSVHAVEEEIIGG